MIPELWTPRLKVLFVDACLTEHSETLGFFHLHQKDRFWELLALGAITPSTVITAKERKALLEGQKEGSLSEPVRAMFIEKKRAQLLRLGIGLTDLNRRVLAADEKDKAGRPTLEDLRSFIVRATELAPRVTAFVFNPDLFVDVFQDTFADASATLGRQPFRIASSEVWLLGSTTAVLRAESLSMQEDAFFELGERLAELAVNAPAE